MGGSRLARPERGRQGQYLRERAGRRIHITAVDGGPQLTADNVFGRPNTTEFAFTVDPDKGRVNFAFPSSAVLHDSGTPPKPLPARYSPKEINDHFDINSPVGQYESRYLI